jgi:hypothetical protein
MINWEQHFRAMRRVPVGQGTNGNPQFGAFLGSHTITDLKQLIAAQDYTFSQIQSQEPKLLMPPLVLDPRVSDWVSDWEALKKRYAVARAKAQSAIDSWSLQPEQIRTAENEYKGVLAALDSSLANPELNGYQKGDLQDLVNRMSDIGAHPQFPNMPQPDPKQDFDQQFIETTKPFSDLGDTILHPWDKFTGQLKAHPVRYAAMGVGVLLALKFVLGFSPAGIAARFAKV